MILSAGGQDEQPWLVNSSTTARGSACESVGNVATRLKTQAIDSERQTRFIAAIPSQNDDGRSPGLDRECSIDMTSAPEVPLNSR
jgi:hypothetical protein